MEYLRNRLQRLSVKRNLSKFVDEFFNFSYHFGRGSPHARRVYARELRCWLKCDAIPMEYHYLCGISPVETILNLNAYPESIMHNSEFISVGKLLQEDKRNK